MRRIFTISIFLIAPGLAQQTVAPTPEPVGSSRGESAGAYNVTDSFETGYRFSTVGGNSAQYDSAVNYHDGVRLLGSFFSMNSRDGKGLLFDELTVSTQGLGNDPYESASVRLRKNHWYRYDMMWRRNDFVDPGLTTDGGGGRHLIDTQLDMQDHNLTLFPQSKLQFFMGYTGTMQNGPALSSMVFYNESGNVYPLFTDVHRVRNEYRAGAEFQILGFRVNWIHGWEDFKEDSPLSLDGPALVTGNSRIAISSFVSSQPYHGTSPYWRVAIFKNIKNLSLNGRFTYTSGARGFVTNEGTVGTTMFGSAQARQVLTYGDAQRPAATGNLTFSYSPFSRLTFVDSTAVYNIRTSGSS